jgi:hypothetical protein
VHTVHACGGTTLYAVTAGLAVQVGEAAGCWREGSHLGPKEGQLCRLIECQLAHRDRVADKARVAGQHTIHILPHLHQPLWDATAAKEHMMSARAGLAGETNTHGFVRNQHHLCPAVAVNWQLRMPATAAPCCTRNSCPSAE